LLGVSYSVKRLGTCLSASLHTSITLRALMPITWIEGRSFRSIPHPDMTEIRGGDKKKTMVSGVILCRDRVVAAVERTQRRQK